MMQHWFLLFEWIIFLCAVAHGDVSVNVTGTVLRADTNQAPGLFGIIVADSQLQYFTSFTSSFFTSSFQVTVPANAQYYFKIIPLTLANFGNYSLYGLCQETLSVSVGTSSVILSTIYVQPGFQLIFHGYDS